MGISEGAVRKRVKRGTIAHDKGEGGRVYVYLDAGVDEGVDAISYPERDALISELRSHNATLQKQLEQANERDRENRRIIAALTSRIPAIEAPSEPRGGPETAESPGPRERPFTDEERIQEAAQPRPWCRRMFGGQA